MNDNELFSLTFTALEVRRIKAALYWEDDCGDLYRKFARLVPPDPPVARPATPTNPYPQALIDFMARRDATWPSAAEQERMAGIEQSRESRA